MSWLVRFNEVSYTVRDRVILQELNARFKTQTKVAIIGHNGAGKSTFLQMLSGEGEVDSGRIEFVDQPTIRYVHQTPPAVGVTQTLGDYFEKIANLSVDLLEESRRRLERLLQGLTLDLNTNVSQLSGGMRRLLDMVVALSFEPDILLLDEPTNHLDIYHISWLEATLRNYSGLLVFVSHDRQLIENIATDLYELERGKLWSYPTVFQDYLQKKQEFLVLESKRSAQLAKLVEREMHWLNRGVTARRKRNQGRLKRLEGLKEDQRSTHHSKPELKLSNQKAERTGQKVIEMKQVSFGYGEQLLVEDFSFLIRRLDRVALVGPNGVGKTTLIELMLKQLKPTSGEVKHGTQLNVAYFDQHKMNLDLSASIIDNVSGSNQVTVAGKLKHISSYMADFSFLPSQLSQPVSSLSGGEKSRVLLAKLLLQPSNVLVLDEPTNDLDMTTLLALEQFIDQYPGTVLMITHDRYFLNQLATQALIFTNSGEIVRDIPPIDLSMEIQSSRRTNKIVKEEKKQSYQVQKRLKKLPEIIDKLESRLSEVESSLADPKWYDESLNNRDEWDSLNQKHAEIKESIQAAYTEWQALEDTSTK